MKAITLTKDQEKANNAFLDFMANDDNFFVIQGAAGTGKSTLIKHLLETFYSRYKSYCLLLQKDVKEFDIKVTATTNKAVSVVNDFIGQVNSGQKVSEIKTIFSLLGLQVENNRDTGKTSLTFNNKSTSLTELTTSGLTPLVFIDEASFIGQDLHEIIVQILKEQVNGKIVYIGDKYQLAPVGQTFSAMDAMTCKRAELNQIVRNDGHILNTGTQFRHTVETGQFNPIIYNGVDVKHVKGPEFERLVNASFTKPGWDPSVSKILAWTNEKVQAYNAHVRTVLGYPEMFQVGETVVTNEYIKGTTKYSKSVDSEVVITKLDKLTHKMYDAVEGYMVELDNRHVGFMPMNYADAKKLMRKFAKEKNWKAYFEVKESWLDLRAVYASSIHKSQGSTYDTVFLDLPDIGKNWNAADVARLMYVGVTRAAKQVICYGYLPDKYC
jgi:energy-coupling factor transporter ATP-binding protein EcfA2